MKKIQLSDVYPYLPETTEKAEVLCRRCVFKEMSEDCPQGVNHPLCFAQENKFHKPIYFKFKKEIEL